MKVRQAIIELEDLDRLDEWIEHAITPDTVKLETLNNERPNDDFFRKMVKKLLSDRIHFLKESEVKI